MEKIKVKISATYIGVDSWDRPTAQDEQGNLYCDVNMSYDNPCWHTMTSNVFDEGEPDKAVDIVVDGVPNPNPFRMQYMLLDRMLGDAKYFINMGGNCSSWTNTDIPKGIKEMRELWDIFPYDAKPKWCTKETIDGLEYIMLHTDINSIFHKWNGTDKSVACRLVLQLMDTEFFDANYYKILEFVLQLFPYIDEVDLEEELNKYI